ncbi:uncharacterized protein LAJ45_07057 [Morchella importuna]|uniref:uncharacterized protein n=1 Tax=Morchella importuna TaxID=1174673 RepID=UPI001E8E7337|nr:uncharacterized protein LAJ45_07057 [Morchella importuna]KAH8148714.1 hypothetical protein LAJ45_07057 [Morchella importuna]
MDEPLSELCIQPTPSPALLQRIHTHDPRRRPDRKFPTPTTTPVESPERKRHNAMIDGGQSSFERPRMRDKGYMSKPTAQSHANRGQQFTVGGVSGGMIYLRPVIRPAHELQQQQFVLPPNTPPNSAEERDNKGWQQDHIDVGDRRVRKQLPPTPPPKTPPRTRSGEQDEYDTFIKSSPPMPRTRNNRAHSYSTINDNCPSFKPPDLGGFRMKVDQVDGPSGERMRPRTAGHPKPFQTLDVQIPHYNLGSPHFSPNASAIPSPIPSPSIISSPTSDVQIPLMSLSSFMPSTPRRRIDPDIYDDLSFPPSSEDPLIVRYDSRQEISAAIPARIISQITSAKFVDYHLLSDFFLTFRLFMSPSDLVAYLITRLRWAFNRDDDTGRVVRVRTFVAIRHWLLNYFADDFVPSFPLREQFVRALNELSNDIRSEANPSDMKIIRELKRCWRRTCALYWDSSISLEMSIDQDIVAGGPPGIRRERSHSTLLRPRTAAPRLESLLPDHSSGTDAFIRQVVEAPAGSRDGREKTQRFTSRPSSNSSSDQVKTPSLPCFAPERASITGRYTPTAQPAQFFLKPKSTRTLTPVSTTNTDELTRKLRPSPHKRSGSFSDALRDTRQPLPLPKSLARSTHLLMAFPYAGSLVRGNLFPPTQAYVEVMAPSTPVAELSNFGALTTLNSSNNGTMGRRNLQKTQHEQYHNNKNANSPGMKKFLGSVRRALSGKVGGNFTNGTMNSPSMGYRNPHQRSPGTNSPQNSSVARFITVNAQEGNRRMSGDSRAARIDLLGAGVVEAFERAMQEEVTLEETQWEQGDFENSDTDIQENSAQLNEVMDGQVDEMIEVGSNVSQDGSASPDITDTAPSKSTKRQRSMYDDEQSHRSFVPLQVRKPQGSEQGEGIKQPQAKPSSTEMDSAIFSGNSRLPRRSKSFSFESFQKNPYLSQIAGVDNMSLHSARSFSLKRLNSGRSQYSVGMDDISEIFGNARSSGSRRRLDLQPSRMLRRRPGGDLRAAATLGDMDMPRPRSTGSVDTATFSTADTFGISVYHRPASTIATSRAESPHQQFLAGVISLGAVAQGGISLPRPSRTLRRHTVARSLGLDPRLSFEVGVQKLRDLPDTESDDGGIEVALMKLEGTYQKKKSSENSPTEDKITSRHLAQDPHESRDSSMITAEEHVSECAFGLDGNDEEDHQKRMKRRQKQVFDQTSSKNVPSEEIGLVTQQVDINSVGIAMTIEGLEEAGHLLEQGLVTNTSHYYERGASNQPLTAIDGAEQSHNSTPILHRTLLPHPSSNDIALRSIDLGLEKHLIKSKEYPRDDTSELSSEMSFQPVSPGNFVSSTFPPIQPGTIIAELGIPSHPLRHTPSPAPNIKSTMSLNSAQATKVAQDPVVPRPQAGAFQQMDSSGNVSSNKPEDSRNATLETTIQPSSIHLPFILAYDSELLAKQFTLIEKDALMEVDWKELVELRWSQTSSNVRDWVEFLNSKDIRGVEVVIARFNLMCKWARSEIVMTKDVHERAKTIVKLIHVAAHARRLQNFATMYQITIALLTADVARLRKTWSIISAADMSTFKEMEALVQPVRNFHNLRTEMDKVTGESGCIPFVGIFTHDLILNAQRALFIATSPTTESLVNFERHRTTAAIVKRLLRLIEASHKYDFKAVDGVCERCLWIASLSDEEIRDLSKALQ